MNLEFHPLCTLFPRLTGPEFTALQDDIRANGLRQPIVLHGGMILDGGNRYRACIEAGVEPVFVEFSGDNLVSFVLSANLHRRHMSAGQQAAIVASAQDWAKANSRGGDRRSDQSATLHFDSAAARAVESGASLRTQKMADKVAKADPDLARQVAHGELSLPKAVKQIEAKADAESGQQEPVKPKDSAEQEDFGPSLEELVDDLQRENAALQDQIKALASDDTKTQLLTAMRRVDHAERMRDDAMAASSSMQKRAERYERMLARCGKAVGERDLDKIAPAVEAMARKAKEVAL